MALAEYKPIHVKKSQSADPLGAVNRMLKLVGDKTLSDVLCALTVFELWISLIGLVLWLTIADSSPELQWQSKGVFLIALLCSLVTGAAAGAVWFMEKQQRPRETSKLSDW